MAAGATPGTFRGFEFPPGLIGHNQPPGIGVRRVVQIDNPNMVADQVEHDRGVYSRAPVKPVQYSTGNIKTSTYNPGLAGYNQRGFDLPDKAADMSTEEYLTAHYQATPEQRLRLQQSILTPYQYFLDTPTLLGTDYPEKSHNMVNNLMLLAKARIKK
tara:strand:- start:12462 stop:12935 length:474 start_codon:yes stop_codon:yes gene_type:complete